MNEMNEMNEKNTVDELVDNVNNVANDNTYGNDNIDNIDNVDDINDDDGTSSRKSHHYGIIATVVVLLVVAFVFALTNPGLPEHRKAIAERISVASSVVDDIDNSVVRSLARIIMNAGDGILRETMMTFVNEGLEYHNYIFFSTTTIHSDMLKNDIKCSTGFLGHVSAVNLASTLPSLMINEMSGDDNDGAEPGTQGDSDDDIDSEMMVYPDGTSKHSESETEDLTSAVTNLLTKEIAKEVKQQVREETDSATASGINSIVDGIVKLINK